MYQVRQCKYDVTLKMVRAGHFIVENQEVCNILTVCL